MSSVLPRVAKGEDRKQMYMFVYTCQKYLWKDTRSCSQWLPPCDLGQAWREKSSPWSAPLSVEFCAQAGKEEGGDCRLWVIWADSHTFSPFLLLQTHREGCGASDLWTIPPEFSISTEAQTTASLESLNVVTRDDGH